MKKNKQRYRLDNSGILHMAVMRKGKSNSFRLSITLHEAVDPELLQAAFQAVTPRFPTMIAGIHNGFFHHFAVPAEQSQIVCHDEGPLTYMPPRKIKDCAMRILYRDCTIAVEFFHSLTDGYGCLVFVKALMAEYLRLAYGVDFSEEEEILQLDELPRSEETVDSFSVYAGEKARPFKSRPSYLPVGKVKADGVHITTGIFDVERMLEAAHHHKVSLTVFLTAVMAESVMELQSLSRKRRKRYKPVQIMIPIDLRRHFPSRTLRNFCLYALPSVRQEDMQKPFAQLTKQIAVQVREQFSQERLQSMMATNVALERSLIRILPLAVKCAGLRMGYHFFGERNSSLSISNLGELPLPEKMQPYVKRADFMLSPRLHSPYNCGVVSCNGRLYFNFSRSSTVPELEAIFFRKLSEKQCVPEIETDGKPVDLQAFLRSISLRGLNGACC